MVFLWGQTKNEHDINNGLGKKAQSHERFDRTNVILIIKQGYLRVYKGVKAGCEGWSLANYRMSNNTITP